MNHRPTTRVLAALELLQTHKRMSGAELARRLGVSTRSVRRYVAALEALGVPITAEQGRDGAYMLVSGFKLPPMMFTDEEALALSVGLLAARELGIAEAGVAADSAQAKLRRVMPEPVRHRLDDVDSTIRLDLTARSGDDGAGRILLGTLCAAAQRRRRLRLHYDSPTRGVTARDIDPYGLSFQTGRWYVVGFCHLRADMRTFRLDRMRGATLLDAGFERPDGFDVLDYLSRSFASMERRHAIDVLLKTTLPSAKEQWVARHGYLEPCDGGVRLTSRTDSLEWYAKLLAGLPFDFEVRAPEELVSVLADVAARIARALTKPGAAA